MIEWKLLEANEIPQMASLASSNPSKIQNDDAPPQPQ